MRKEFVMRGQTASGGQEVLNFGKYKAGYAYRMTELQIYPSTNIPSTDFEGTISVTAGKTAVASNDPNFNDEGLIGVSLVQNNANNSYPASVLTVIDDTFIITQNLILFVFNQGGSNEPVNWQCRFKSVKMTGPEEAAVNYKQYAISDE